MPSSKVGYCVDCEKEYGDIYGHMNRSGHSRGEPTKKKTKKSHKPKDDTKDKKEPVDENLWSFEAGYDAFYLCKLCHNIVFFRYQSHECQLITETSNALTHAACLSKSVKMNLIEPVSIHPFLKVFFPSKVSYYTRLDKPTEDPTDKSSDESENGSVQSVSVRGESIMNGSVISPADLSNRSNHKIQKEYIIKAISDRTWAPIKPIIQRISFDHMDEMLPSYSDVTRENTLTLEQQEAAQRVETLKRQIRVNEAQANSLKAEAESIKARNRVIKIELEDEIVRTKNIADQLKMLKLADREMRQIRLFEYTCRVSNEFLEQSNHIIVRDNIQYIKRTQSEINQARIRLVQMHASLIEKARDTARNYSDDQLQGKYSLDKKELTSLYRELKHIKIKDRISNDTIRTIGDLHKRLLLHIVSPYLQDAESWYHSLENFHDNNSPTCNMELESIEEEDISESIDS